MDKEIILASGSPRRIEIMEREGCHPIVCPADVDETLPQGIEPEDAVMYLALKKALAVEAEHPEFAGKTLIAADTVVYKERILGKPADLEDARDMIRSIRNTSHQVMTGVCLLVCGEKRRRCFVDTTHIHCTDYSDEFIESYIRTEEPYDKAGGYAIQLTFGKYIDHIEGDYDNVVGLPYHHVEEELKLL